MTADLKRRVARLEAAQSGTDGMVERELSPQVQQLLADALDGLYPAHIRDSVMSTAQRGPGRGRAAVITGNELSAPITSRSSADQARPGLVAELDALFRGRWPGQLRALFDPYAPTPLAIGIDQAIVEHLGLTAADHRRLGRLLAKWCTRPSYLKALLVKGAARYGLDGSSIEPVCAGAVKAARAQLHRRNVKLARQREIEEERERAKATERHAQTKAAPKHCMAAAPRTQLLAEEARRVRANVAKPTLRLVHRS